MRSFCPYTYRWHRCHHSYFKVSSTACKRLLLISKSNMSIREWKYTHRRRRKCFAWLIKWFSRICSEEMEWEQKKKKQFKHKLYNSSAPKGLQERIVLANSRADSSEICGDAQTQCIFRRKSHLREILATFPILRHHIPFKAMCRRIVL